MRMIAASALAIAVAAGGVMIAPATADAQSMTSTDIMGMRDNLIRTRDITGGNIYTMNEADDEGWDPAMTYDAVGADWNDIGEIEDIILSKDGQMVGIVAEVGGFLDIADKHVVIPVQNVSLVAVDDETYSYVTRMSEEELEELEGVDEGFWN
jgi:hypothetical protein